MCNMSPQIMIVKRNGYDLMRRALPQQGVQPQGVLASRSISLPLPARQIPGPPSPFIIGADYISQNILSAMLVSATRLNTPSLLLILMVGLLLPQGVSCAKNGRKSKPLRDMTANTRAIYLKRKLEFIGCYRANFQFQKNGSSEWKRL
jgi:hypothetical protein